MALSDTISELQDSRITGKGKITKLLQKLQDESRSEFDFLLDSLNKSNDELPAHILTKALWREYGPDCVDPDSVSKFRTRYARSVNGL